MRKSLKFVAAVMSLAMVMAPVALAGCSDDTTPPDDGKIEQPNEVKVTGVSVTAAELLFAGNLAAGGTVSLTGEVAPANATDKSLTWSSGNTAVATVNENGLVTGVGAGTAVIKATAKDGSGVYGEYTVNVYAAKSSFSGENATLKGCYYNENEKCVGGLTAGATIEFNILSENAQTATLQLDVAVPESAAYASYALHFASVTVGETTVAPESDGILCGTNYGWANHGIIAIEGVQLAAGENKIVITAAETVATNLFSLTVFGESVSEKIFVPETPITEGVSLSFAGKDAERTEGEFGAITVDGSGKLANINENKGATLTYKIDVAADCKVGLYLSLAYGGKEMKNIFTLTVNGEEIAIPATYTATDSWTTFEEVWLANVALKADETNVIVLTVTGNCGNYDYMKLVGEGLSVIHKVTGVTLSSEGEKDTVLVGGTLQLTATVAPEDATDKAVVWSSGNTAVATVDDNGVVTGVSEGTAVIKATAADGSDVYGEFTVTVKTAVKTQLDITKAETNGNCRYNPNENNIGNLAAGDTITFKITSDNAQTASFVFDIAILDADRLALTKTFSSVMVGETSLDLQGIMATCESTNYGWACHGIATIEGVRLAAGDTTIVITLAEGVSSNFFGLTIVGDYAVAHKVETPITEGTAYYFEGEDAALTGGITVNTSDANARNNTSLGGINENKGATVTYKIESKADGKAGLYLSLAFGSQTVSGIFTLKVNDTEVVIPSTFTATSENWTAWSTYEEYWLANIDLVEGENVIVLTVTGGCGNYDYMKLISGAELSLVEEEIEPPITEGTSLTFAGKDAVITDGNLGAITVGADGKLGNINDNKGATLTYTVNTSSACSVGLYLNLAFGGQTVSGIFTLKVNGKEVKVPGTFTATGENWTAWSTYEEYWLANIDLVAGENIIELTVTGGCGNYDYMKLVGEGLQLANTDNAE